MLKKEFEFLLNIIFYESLVLDIIIFFFLYPIPQFIVPHSYKKIVNNVTKQEGWETLDQIKELIPKMIHV